MSAEHETANFNKLTDDQLTATVDYFTERLYYAERDLDEAIGHAALRGLVPTVPEPSNVVSMADFRLRKQLNI